MYKAPQIILPPMIGEQKKGKLSIFYSWGNYKKYVETCKEFVSNWLVNPPKLSIGRFYFEGKQNS